MGYPHRLIDSAPTEYTRSKGNAYPLYPKGKPNRMAEAPVLDDQSIDIDELSMPALAREISLQKRPNALLVKMMNALEGKRQARGLGWSRAWNKYGLNVFRTHTCDVRMDGDYVEPVIPFLKTFLAGAPEPFAAFADDLLNDPNVMAFTFYHNHEDENQQLEGLTLSFGRKRTEDKTKRDRLDIILEDRRMDGHVDGMIDRLRIYVCPWSHYAKKEFHLVEIAGLAKDDQEACQAIYDHAVRYYHEWKSDPERQWSHWSTRFIDYFGPRTFIPQNSSFI